MNELRYTEVHARRLREDAEALAALVAKHDDATWRSKRLGEWTAKEVLGHLTQTAEVFAERVRRCVVEERPRFPDFDADRAVAEARHNEGDPARLASRVATANEEIATLLAEPWNLDRIGFHEIQGERTAGHFGAYHAEHAHGHVEELRSLFA